ncbi:WhiB family transcriptional regulator [Trueperella abortisuis]|uniref:WhiB family transcriptional regulator n=1 Tax=Trueperella abortisuis TaxID=445930 RepID=UPI0028930289|nr:WhiB family transcriptional regulator [Trueperella abortisuis]
MPTRFRHHPACADLPPKVADALFFPAGEQNQDRVLPTAAKLCATCPAKNECEILVDQLEAGKGRFSRYGIWAGTTPAQRAPQQADTSQADTGREATTSYVTPAQAAQALGVKRNMIYCRIRNHKIIPKRVGRNVLIPTTYITREKENTK